MTSLTTLMKNDVRLAKQLMGVVKDNHALENLLRLTDKASDLEKLLARTTNVKQLTYLLMHYSHTPRLLELLGKATSASQLTKLLDAVGGNIQRFGRMADKVDNLALLENTLIGLAGDGRRLEKLVDAMQDQAQLTRLLDAVDGRALRLEGLLKDRQTRRARSAAQDQSRDQDRTDSGRRSEHRHESGPLAQQRFGRPDRRFGQDAGWPCGGAARSGHSPQCRRTHAAPARSRRGPASGNEVRADRRPGRPGAATRRQRRHRQGRDQEHDHLQHEGPLQPRRIRRHGRWPDNLHGALPGQDQW